MYYKHDTVINSLELDPTYNEMKLIYNLLIYFLFVNVHLMMNNVWTKHILILRNTDN
jgi:hypothetical protein